MSKNKILDYEQVLEELNKIQNKGIIVKEPDIGKTAYGLPIEHYTVGKGKNNIVITGATHGCEIITTDFILNLMHNISDKSNSWKNILDEYTIHFIPLLNPEGYLISTSAIRKKIPRSMPSDEAEKICKEYFLLYKQDDLSDSDIKKHQEMFADVDYTCIPKKYSKIRLAVKEIFEKYPDLPKGCLQTWSANANGIDIQANSEYNPAVEKINNNENIFMKTKRNNNINTAHPGPINCPFNKVQGKFKKEKETLAISNFLDELSKESDLLIYLNYHSSGGMIFQRPANIPEGLDIDENDILEKELNNYLFSRIYAEKTVRDKKKNEKYKIYPSGLPFIKTRSDVKKGEKHDKILKNTKATSLNDILRLKYCDLLIELSAMGGNPIGPYGDLSGNYKNVMESNVEAVYQLLKYAVITNMISKECADVIKKVGHKKGTSKDEQYTINSEILDFIYLELTEKIEMLKNAKQKNVKENHENR